MDDRPVTWRLPIMLGQIAGREVVTPPLRMLGNNLQPGAPDAIIAWLNARAPQAQAYVLSSDMLAYGGLIASRVPGPSYADAYTRLREIDRLRVRYPDAWIGVFGTIMRLAPTGVPANTPFFAPYPTWSYLQQYANLHDPLEPAEENEAQRLRGLIGESVLDAYLQTRARNYGVDRLLIGYARTRSIDRLVLGQDDAKRAACAIARRSSRAPMNSAWPLSRVYWRARHAGRRASRCTTRRRKVRHIKIRWNLRRPASRSIV